MNNSAQLLLDQGPWLGVALFCLLGLMIGSFLNVVIYRLPVMMHAQWEAECAHLHDSPEEDTPTFNLWVPRSRCMKCQHTLSWRENIPVLSFLLQAGKCRHCAVPISKRYPMVEIATAVIFGLCASRWGVGLSALVWSGFASAVLALALIDWDTTYLPDDITLPLLWAGLIAAWAAVTPVQAEDAIAGAALGYLFLWAIYWGFKLLTGKEGMGYGDFKLFAALGAWFGWQALLPIILMASVIGTLVGLVMKFNAKLRDGAYIPFGPFLAGAGLTAMWLEPAGLLRLLGL